MDKKKGRPPLPGKRIGVRLYPITLDRINFHVAKVKADTGVDITQEQSIRLLIELGLKQVGQ